MAPVWHEDVRFFLVKKDGKPKVSCERHSRLGPRVVGAPPPATSDATHPPPQAYFYFDPYSRPAEKRGGAW